MIDDPYYYAEQIWRLRVYLAFGEVEEFRGILEQLCAIEMGYTDK